MVVTKVRPGEPFEPVFRAIAQSKVGAMWVQPSLNRDEIADLVQKSAIPTMSSTRWLTNRSGLLTYGANDDDIKRQLAGFVVRVLKGAKPADLPIEQPTKFETIINLKSAKAIGLTVPPLVLARADEVIE